MTYSLSSTDGITSGTTYSFKFRSKNIVDYSDFSEELRIAVASPPAKPSTPVKDFTRTNRTSLVVTWSESTATEVPILGYKLYLSAGTDEYSVIYEDA